MEKGAVTKMARLDVAANQELSRRLQISFLLRVIIVTFLFVATVVIHITRTSSFLTIPLIALYILSGVTYFFTLVSVIYLRWGKHLTGFALVQIIWETIFVTVLIYITGGTESIFSFMYLLAIIVAGITLYRTGAFLAALTSSAFYGTLIACIYLGYVPTLLPQMSLFQIQELFYNFSIILSANFGMAFFTSYLTEKLQSTGDELIETLKDMDALEAINDNIVHSLTSGLITLDLDGRITSFNEAAESITSFNRFESINMLFIDLFPHIINDPEKKPFEKRRQASRWEIEWKQIADEIKNLELRISPLFGAHKEQLGYIVIINDITDIRKMEERLRKTDRLAAVGQLAAGIAHEIRNPLASISGSIQMLKNELDLDQMNERLMKIVIRETERLNSLITDFLLYARPSPRVSQSIVMDLLLRDVVEVFKQATDLPTPLKWEINLEKDLEINTDPKLLEQIIWNLLHNSVQAMPKGGKISLTGYTLSGNETQDNSNLIDKMKMIRIQITDTGTGISPEMRDKIFDPFFTTRENGSGLGLSVVHRIVEALEGTIKID